MDTIPVEEREAAKSRQLKLLRSSADQNTELSDIPLREIDWNKVDVIYAYENLHGSNLHCQKPYDKRNYPLSRHISQKMPVGMLFAICQS